MRLVIGMSGATGAPFGVRLLELASEVPGLETHLVLSRWARATIELETPYTVTEVSDLATVAYGANDQAAAISSGSFHTDGMIVAPCSMKTLAGIRAGYSDNLLTRAADVCLKERRRLVLVARETPLSEIHLENMLALSRMGAVILPPVPAFYGRPAGISEILDHIAMRVFDQFGIEVETGAVRWTGLAAAREQRTEGFAAESRRTGPEASRLAGTPPQDDPDHHPIGGTHE
ncbi:MAG: UbiX family flavin prenyltransferase [Solirubrobacterales bacterium]